MSLPKNKWELIVTSKDKRFAGDNLVKLVQSAYEKAPQGSFVKSLKDVIPSDWIVIDTDEDPDINATIFFRGPRGAEKWSGRKIQGIGHDGSAEAKTKVIEKLVAELSKKGTWIEASEALRKVLLQKNVTIIEDETLLRTLFNSQDLTMIDKETYTRTAGGTKITETVFGAPVIK